MTVVVRPATPEDAPAIIRLNTTFNDLRATPEHVADHLANRTQFEQAFVAEVNGQVVGMVGLRILPCLCDPIPYAELTELFVDPSARRLGVGRALVERCEEHARVAGAVELVLLTAWCNTGAHAFYHALGYGLYTVTMRRRLVD